MERPKPEGAVVELKSIGVEGAVALREFALEAAQEMGVSGFIVVYSRTGMQETSQALGSASPLSVEVANAKAKTVLAVRRSTSVQRDRMKEKDQSREDFGEQLGSLFGGGIAIFVDKEKTQFVGAIAFSGGTEEQDEEICRQAVEKIGLFTDVPKPLDKITLEDMNLPVKIYNILLRAGINTLADLTAVTDEQLLELRNLRPRDVQWIRAKQDYFSQSVI